MVKFRHFNCLRVDKKTVKQNLRHRVFFWKNQSSEWYMQ